VTLGVDPLEDEKGSSGTTSKADGLDGDDEVDTADATAESPVSVVSVNETLVAEGLCRADGRKDVAPPELRERLAAAQERARVDRAGMWEYGDVDSDDEEPTLAKPGAWGRRR
jgi:staphylococcal nuclease domain-containing protein 1